MDPERCYDASIGLPARIYRDSQPDWVGVWIAAERDPNCDKKIDGSALDRLNKWFNTSCFSVPNAGFVAADPFTNPGLRWQLGNEPRIDPDLRGQGVNNWNLAIAKRTSIHRGVEISHCARRRSTSSSRAVWPAEHAGDHGRVDHVRSGYDTGESASIDATGVSADVQSYPRGFVLSDSPTRALARRFAGALRSRGSLAMLVRTGERADSL